MTSSTSRKTTLESGKVVEGRSVLLLRSLYEMPQMCTLEALLGDSACLRGLAWPLEWRVGRPCGNLCQLRSLRRLRRLRLDATLDHVDELTNHGDLMGMMDLYPRQDLATT